MKPPRNITAHGEHAQKAGRIEITPRPCFRCDKPTDEVIGKFDLDLNGIADCKKHKKEAQLDLLITMTIDENHFEKKYFPKKKSSKRKSRHRRINQP